MPKQMVVNLCHFYNKTFSLYDIESFDSAKESVDENFLFLVFSVLRKQEVMSLLKQFSSHISTGTLSLDDCCRGGAGLRVLSYFH